MNIRYTNIQHTARKRLRISFMEYAVCEGVFFKQSDPTSLESGWCTVPRHEMAAFYDLSERGLYKLINRMIDKGILKKNSKGYLKTTSVWFKNAVSNAEQSSDDTMNKVPIDTELSSDSNLNKVPTNPEQSSDTLYNNKNNNKNSNNNKRKNVREEETKVLKSKNFKKPSIEELEAYFLENGLTPEVANDLAKRFINHYECIDWYVGKKKMSRWRNAAAGWILRMNDFKNNSNSKNYNNGSKKHIQTTLERDSTEGIDYSKGWAD